MQWSINACQNKVSADQYHVTISRPQVYSSSRSMFFRSSPLTQRWVFDWIAGSCKTNLLKTGQDCSEAEVRIRNEPNSNFFFYTNVFCCFVLCIW